MLETNPYLLALTFVVSIVHSVFEFLAFKNGKFYWIFDDEIGKALESHEKHNPC